MNITKGKMSRPARVAIYGVEGCGKTSLVSQINNALIVDTEKGSAHVDCDRVEVKEWADMKQIYMEILSLKRRGELPYNTIAIDSIERLEAMLIEYICRANGKSSIEDFGYGKGFTMLREHFSKFLAGLDALSEAGLNLVIVGHSEVKRTSDPMLGEYDRHEIRLTKQNSPVLKEWADEVWFMRFQTQLKPAEGFSKAMAIGGKERILCCQHSAAFDAKSRAGLDAEIKAEYKAIKHVFGSTKTEKKGK